MMHRLIVIARCAEDYFSDIIREAPLIYSDKVRLILVDGSFMVRLWILDIQLIQNIRFTGNLKMKLSE